jgi:tetratricopeptide (TPR) repeat protein
VPAGLSDGFLPDLARRPLVIQNSMPNESPAAGSGASSPQPASSLSPAERSRLAQCFQHGTQSIAKNVDYAVEMFAVCVAGDPSNAIYLQNLLGALRVKHAGKKGGGLSALWSAGGRGSLRKLAAAGKWREVITQGLDIVRSNPGDHGSLLVMAEAAGRLGFADAQKVYLKAALDAAPADVEVNRKCADFLASYGEYDQAVACWMRIEKVKGMADEAQRQIAKLQVDKTIAAGEGLTGRKPSAGAAPPAPGAAATGAAAGGGQKTEAAAEGETAKQRRAALLEAIKKNPADIEPYLELADVVEHDGTVEEAQQVLAKALAASGNDLKVREHMEDRQLRWTRHRLHIAEKRLAEEDTPENRQAVERLKATQLKYEIEVYSARTLRYPENVSWKYELAMRLKAAGNHSEAIRQFQDVLQDARRKGAVALELGECFQKIRQYALAMRNYQAAVESLTDREQDLRKRALYRAGVLAAGLDDVDSARKYLSMLAELDFGYRDVAQRLDKLTPAKDKGAGS